jgi:protein-L-isoaspartate O-methyltransferase
VLLQHAAAVRHMTFYKPTGAGALQDRPLPNGPTETISAPHMHAIALELLSSNLQPGKHVLDIGSVRT